MAQVKTNAAATAEAKETAENKKGISAKI